jgi:putative zinc finger protein
MTPNDKQIDLLMRRHASMAQPEITGGHLDADEMNTFAEGSLPPATRARYVSHLASCGECREQVAQIALAGGAVVRAESAVVERPRRGTFWEGVSALFTPRGLRYAAFAAVLLIVAGIGFIALRRPPQPKNLVASRTESDEHPASAIQPPASSSNGSATETNTRPQQSNSPSTASTGSDQSEKRDADKLAQAAPAPVMMKESPAAPAVETRKAAAESELAKNQPSYAPPPPGDAGQPTSVGGVVAKQTPIKIEPMDKVATADRERSQGIIVTQARDDRQMKDQSVVQRRGTDEKTKGGPSRNMENRSAGTANENRVDNTPLSLSAPKPSEKEEAQTRSVGGRKFRKQGSAWVDQKYKSSMTLKSVARGSDEFDSLDSGLRSIAQQLSGEVIVVWKGKAYVIK